MYETYAIVHAGPLRAKSGHRVTFVPDPQQVYGGSKRCDYQFAQVPLGLLIFILGGVNSSWEPYILDPVLTILPIC